MKKATETFGDVRLDRLSVSELSSWRATLPTGSAYQIVKALRQVLSYGVDVGLLDKNPAKSVKVSAPKRKAILPFANLDEIESVANELTRIYRAIPIFGCLTGLRPSELLAFERRDVDRSERVLHVRRVLIDGAFREHGKTYRSLRVVPLTARALEALDEHPARLDTPLIFSTKRGTPIDLHAWRCRHWTPALRGAGLAHRTPYAMRHTFASWAIAAGLPTYEIATTMGTSLEQLSETYAHLLSDSAERARVVLDSFVAAAL